MAVTTVSAMQIVPNKFGEYVLNRTTEKSALVRSGIFTSDQVLRRLINGMPQGGRFIEMPMFNALDNSIDDDIFNETALTPNAITTASTSATILMRQKAWGATDLARVYGGADPMAAIGNLLSDWWVQKEQKIVKSILTALLDASAGCLKDHMVDISGEDSANYIDVNTTLDAKQVMGDAADKLGVVFMHSATYTSLQKQQQITTEYSSDLKVHITTYLGYQVIVDDDMPADSGVYTTYFIGKGAFAREDGTPEGFITVETDRDKLAGQDVLINRRALVIHPLGCSWNTGATLTTSTDKYPANVDLAKPANWTLGVNHKKVPIVALKHKLKPNA